MIPQHIFSYLLKKYSYPNVYALHSTEVLHLEKQISCFCLKYYPYLEHFLFTDLQFEIQKQFKRNR